MTYTTSCARGSMSKHATLSPSGAHRWMNCAGSVVLEAGKPDTSSEYSDEGTAAHAVAVMALTECRPCSAYIGRRIEVREHKTVEVTRDMADNVQIYVDAIVDKMADFKTAGAVSVELMVEQQLPIGHITGEKGATGTGDVVLIVTWADDTVTIGVDDLKFGRGVEVSVEENEQLQLYGLGAIEMLAPLGLNIKDALLAIHQPRIKREPSEWKVSVDDLQRFAAKAATAAKNSLGALESGGTIVLDFNPGPKTCRWCKAKATCPALAAKVEQEVGADFDDLNKPCVPEAALTQPEQSAADDLARMMSSCDLIEMWMRAVRAEVERRLLAGDKVPGYKIVQGRAGARAWSDTEAATKLLRETFRLPVEEAFDMKLISPTSAEKLKKEGKIGPKQWPKVEALVTRSAGSLSVAPESDKRPAVEIKPLADEFENLDKEIA